jgi:Helix-turn-helix domain
VSAFDVIRWARDVRRRHPDLSPAAAHVYLVMATYADGRTGGDIRPSYATVADLTGHHMLTVRRAVHRLIALGELERVGGGNGRGSAALFRIPMPKKEVLQMAPSGVRKGGATSTSHQPDQSAPASPAPHDELGSAMSCATCGDRAVSVTEYRGHTFAWCKRHAKGAA